MSFPFEFLAGSVTALVLVALVLFIITRRFTQKRADRSKIKGYLDLIPDLSMEQRKKVQEIRRTFLPRVGGIREDLRRERAELARLLFAEPRDRDRIDDVASRILRHQSNLEREVIEHILEEQDLLTPSQKQRFYEIIIEQFASGGLGVHDVRARY